MKIDAELFAAPLSEVPPLARRAEEYGFDCIWVNETKHDPFVQLALASTATKMTPIGTSIALAFTRSPTSLAYAAWDLQSISGGRLLLGLGSQVKGHVERRFGMKWESPTPKMKETIGVLRAVWDSWQNGKRLDFQGRFYKIDLMTPFFSPGPIEHPRIPTFVAGVNRGMCRLVGEVGDGLHVHPLHTTKYLREVMIPSLSEGLAKSKRERKAVEVAASVFAAVGEDASEIKSVRNVYRSQIAFYASTRTYRKVLELSGWGDVCDRLHEHSLKGEWKEMDSEISEEILDEFVVEGTWDSLGGVVRKKYGDLVDRLRIYLPFDGSDRWRRLAAGFRS